MALKNVSKKEKKTEMQNANQDTYACCLSRLFSLPPSLSRSSVSSFLSFSPSLSLSLYISLCSAHSSLKIDYLTGGAWMDVL